MGYYGVSQYRGDYYPTGSYGDYYPTGSYGDPGFFDFVSDVVGKVVDVGSGLMKVAQPVLAQINPAFGAAAGIAPKMPGVLGGLTHFLDRPAPRLGGTSNAGRVLQLGPPTGPMMASLSQGGMAMGATAPGTASTGFMVPATGTQMFLDRNVGPHLGLGTPARGVFRRAPPMPGGAPTAAAQHGVMRGVPPLLRRPRVAGRRRRVNPLNPRALSRAIRRARGFEKYARKVLHFVAPHKHVDGFKAGFARSKKRS